MRVRVVVPVLIILAAGIGPGARADAAHTCDQTLQYRYCGEHPVGLPLRARVITSGSPVGDALREVVDRAVRSWNVAWLEAAAAAGIPWADAANPTCPAICLDPGGTTTISFREGLGGTCSGDGRAVAVACLTMAGTTGHTAHHIVRGDVLLNASLSWRIASGSDVVSGEVEAFGSLRVDNEPLLCAAEWWDVESVVAHELGHLFGLEDLPTNWPASFTHAASVRQTMSVPGRPCTTNRRTIEEGDLLGLRSAVSDSARDR